jgi:hypothetical protein
VRRPSLSPGACRAQPSDKANVAFVVSDGAGVNFLSPLDVFRPGGLPVVNGDDLGLR